MGHITIRQTVREYWKSGIVGFIPGSGRGIWKEETRQEFSVSMTGEEECMLRGSREWEVMLD